MNPIRIAIVVTLFMHTLSLHAQQNKVLVFYKTAGYHHASILPGVQALIQLGNDNHIAVDTTNDAAQFTFDNLQQYKAIIFLSTTGDILNNEQQDAFKKYINKGGGYVGIHAASDCENNWEWYGKLVGGYFKEHDAVQPAKLKIKSRTKPDTHKLPREWTRTDEWYQFNWTNKAHLKVLIDIEDANPRPITWYHKYDGGRIFYTALGHTTESYTEPFFLELLRAGINYAMGK